MNQTIQQPRASKRTCDTSENSSSKRTNADPKILDGTFFFIDIRNGDNVKAVCTTCGKSRSGSIKGTGNFTRHIRTEHPELNERMIQHITKSTNVLTSAGYSKLHKTVITPAEVCYF